MHTPADKPLRAGWANAGGAALLLGFAASVPLTVPGVAPVEAPPSAAMPGSVPAPDLPPAFDAPTAPPSSAKCAECGVIESTQEIDAVASNALADQTIPAKRYETVVRFQDGSTRIIRDVNPAQWRPGERIVLIAGRK
jgi:hypothetical protein